MIKAYKIQYDLPGIYGNQEIVLANNVEESLPNLEKKDPRFKNIGGHYEVQSIKEVSLDAVPVSKLSVTELLMLIKN